MHSLERLHGFKEQILPYEETFALLAPALGAAVPLYVIRFQQRGGITDEDIACVQSYLEDITAHGDDFSYHSEKSGGGAEMR